VVSVNFSHTDKSYVSLFIIIIVVVIILMAREHKAIGTKH